MRVREKNMDNIIIKTEHFSFRIINANDYDLYYKLMLDEPEIQWVFQVDDIKEKSVGCNDVFLLGTFDRRKRT